MYGYFTLGVFLGVIFGFLLAGIVSANEEDDIDNDVNMGDDN